MKKLVISGSTKLRERALYWRGYFEGRGYEVIDWPSPVSDETETLNEPQTAPGLSLGRWLSSGDSDYAERLTKVYQRFFKNIDQADTFFLMNEDKNGIEGYIGASSFAELAYAVINNLNRGKKIEIYILKLPSKEQNCYEEVKFWLEQKFIHLYRRPTGKKATIPVPDPDKITPPSDSSLTKSTPSTLTISAETPSRPQHIAPSPTEAIIVEPTPSHQANRHGNSKKIIDIITCKKSVLDPLTQEIRQYLKILSPDFPAWLLKYLAAPEMQRLAGVSVTCGLDYTTLYSYRNFLSVFAHSLGVALIVWNFTHDKKQTLAGLFHDIASPAFKHTIDYMNGDYETQESTEARTEQIIRNSRVIRRQLKKDGILVSEVSNYHLYPIADNDSPNLAADRLEYTLSNGLFLYDTWGLTEVQTFYHDLKIMKNENDIDELGFATPEIAADFTIKNLPLSAIYHGDKSRASMQFLSDVLNSMIANDYLNTSDLYSMSEREIVDWILSCGDKTISEAFRQYQCATSVFGSNTPKKSCYCVSVKYKIRYIVPLCLSDNTDENASVLSSRPTPVRITEINDEVSSAVADYLDEKPAKYVGFDFSFSPFATE